MPTARQQILVVDDDADIREILVHVLRDRGFDVATAANGAEAIRTLRNNGKPAVILLDLMMPSMDGWAFRREQKQDPKLCQIPVVVLSAAGYRNAKEAGIDVDALLTKPIDLDVLIGTIERCSQRNAA